MKRTAIALLLLALVGCRSGPNPPVVSEEYLQTAAGPGGRPGGRVVYSSEGDWYGETRPAASRRSYPATTVRPGGEWVEEDRPEPATRQVAYKPAADGGRKPYHPLAAKPAAARPPARPAADRPAPPAPLPDLVGEVADAPTVSGVRYVASRRLRIAFDVTGVGTDGVAGVDLWHTRDGRRWKRIELTGEQTSPVTVEVAGEGRYGFTTVARGGAGQAVPAPRPGDVPQMWVEVDQTRPVVKLSRIEEEVGPDGVPGLGVRWEAQDRNLGLRPITVEYAEQPAGPWFLVAADLENTGHYLWKDPAGLPPHFFVRVTATDQAGNRGTDHTPRPVAGRGGPPAAAVSGVEPADVRRVNDEE
jgi:hypothetical protein